MFPKLRQRLVIGVAFLIGAAAWQLAYPGLCPAGAATGLVLLRGGVLVSLSAWALLLLAGLPALGAGLAASAAGNPLSGLFVATAALTTLAWRGGGIDGWLWRPSTPGSYAGLMVECVIWLALLAGLIAAIEFLRPRILARWPKLDDGEHFGTHLHFALPDVQALSAGLACLLVGGGLALLLVRSSERAQVIDGLILAFMLGGLAGQLCFPQHNPVAMLLSPLVAGLVVYGWTLFAYAGPAGAGAGDASTQFFRAWHQGHLPGLALVLPVHLASAAVCGVTLGIGWALGLQGAPNPKHHDDNQEEVAQARS
jgi:hypothetical protein